MNPLQFVQQEHIIPMGSSLLKSKKELGFSVYL